MANFAKLIIQFTDYTSSQGALLKIRWNNGANIDRDWSAEDLRTNAYQYTRVLTNANDQTTECFNAVSADIANDGTLSPYMTVTKTATDTFEIEANEYGWTIEDNGTTLDVEATLTAVPEVLPAKDFQLTGYSLSSATNACADINVTLTQNGDGVAPFTWISPANASTTLSADLTRALGFISITIEDSEGDQATLQNVLIPGTFDSSFIDEISIVANAGGLDSTVTIFMNNPFSINSYTYSLDGSNFQASNVFPNVIDGTYTIYVNDGFGCIATQQFDVNASENIERREPFADVPTANSQRMIQRTTNKYQSLDNTLYVDERFFNEEKKRYFQPYQTNDDSVTTQFSTNYDSLSASIVDCQGNTIKTLAIDKKTDNLDAQDKRDCTGYNKGNDQTGIYFTTGNIYEPGTTTIIDTYKLDGKLPEWAQVGNTIILNGQVSGSFLIKQTVYDASVEADVIVIDNVWDSGNQSEALTVDVTYDKVNYETYEFNVDMNTLSEGVYKNVLLIQDSLGDWEDIVYDSESYELKASHRGTMFIEYSESSGTGIDYTTGYEGRVRVQGLTPLQQIDFGGTVDAYADAGENLIKADDNPTRGGLAWFDHQPRFMLEKLRLIFSHNEYSINDQEYQNAEEFELGEYNGTSLRNASISLQTVGYEAYNNDNIDVDGERGKILTEEFGNLLR